MRTAELNELDQLYLHLDRDDEPWSVHLEVRVDAALDEDALRAAVREATGRHPRARLGAARGTDVRYRWEIADELLRVPLDVVQAMADPALEAARSSLLSTSVPLDEAPPFRLTLARHPAGDSVIHDHLGADRRFSAEDEELLKGFATSAPTAVANAQTVEADRMRESFQAAEQERQRWARELHDETLQGLASLAVGLRTARRSGDQDALGEAVDAAVGQIQLEIANLRSLITQLRPAALDDLGLQAAIRRWSTAWTRAGRRSMLMYRHRRPRGGMGLVAHLGRHPVAVRPT